MKNKYARKELGNLIYDMLLAESNITKKKAAKQLYNPSGRNKAAGMYSGMGGAPAVSAILLAMDNAIPASKKYTIVLDKALTKKPSTNEIVIAGAGQQVEDIKFHLGLLGGSGTCDVEVKYGGTPSKNVSIVVTNDPGLKIPNNKFDAIVFVEGGANGNLQETVSFCVGLGGSGSGSSAGKKFLGEVFSAKPTKSVISELNSATKVTKKGGSRVRKFSYNTLDACKSSIEIKKLPSTIGSGGSINAAMMNAVAYTSYCTQDQVNIQRAQDLAAAIGKGVKKEDIIEVQCQFDQNGSSCFASVLHGNGRYLPLIPEFTKSKYKQYQKILVSAWPDFVKNTKTCSFYDFSGQAVGTGTNLRKTSTIQPPNLGANQGNGAPVNVIFQQITGKSLAQELSVASDPVSMQKAIDILFNNLSSTGRISKNGIEAALAKGVEVEDIIAVIKIGVPEKSILKTALVSIYRAAESANISGLPNVKSGSKKQKYYNAIINLSLAGSTQITVQDKPSAVAALGVQAAASLINAYRIKKGWAAIKSSHLKKVAKSKNKFTWRDVYHALKHQSPGNLTSTSYLPENFKSLNPLTKDLIFEILKLSDTNLNIENIDLEDAQNVLPSDFKSLLPGEFVARVDLNSITKLVNILDDAEVTAGIFSKALSEIIAHEETEADNIANNLGPRLNQKESSIFQFTGNLSNVFKDTKDLAQADLNTDTSQQHTKDYDMASIDNIFNAPDSTEEALPGSRLTMETVRRIVRKNLLKEIKDK